MRTPSPWEARDAGVAMRHTVYLDNFEDINAHMTMQQVRLPSSLQTPALPLVWPFA